MDNQNNLFGGLISSYFLLEVVKVFLLMFLINKILILLSLFSIFNKKDFLESTILELIN